MPGRMPQQIAVAFALCAFLVAIGAGLVTSLPTSTTLARSLVVLVASYPIGRALGALLQVALNEHLTSMTKANPIPASLGMGRASASAGSVDVELGADVESA